MARVYTRTGDFGETSLFDGQRVAKNSLRVAVCGDVDELNSVVGLAASFCVDEKLVKILRELQLELFQVGADIATPLDSITKKPITRIALQNVTFLEERIDEIEKGLEPVKNFILPCGTSCSAALHVARSVCRRAERSACALQKSEKVNFFVLTYLNRLSDFLFILARYVNKIEGKIEEKWRGGDVNLK